MAVPKKRTSKSKTNKRKTAWKKSMLSDSLLLFYRYSNPKDPVTGIGKLVDFLYAYKQENSKPNTKNSKKKEVLKPLQSESGGFQLRKIQSLK